MRQDFRREIRNVVQNRECEKPIACSVACSTQDPRSPLIHFRLVIIFFGVDMSISTCLIPFPCRSGFFAVKCDMTGFSGGVLFIPIFFELVS